MVQATHTSRGGESLFYLIFLFPHFAFLSPLLSRATPDKPCMCDFDVQALFLVTLGPKVRAAPPQNLSLQGHCHWETHTFLGDSAVSR